MALKRSQKSITEDPDVLLRVGMNKELLSTRGGLGVYIEVPEKKNPLKSKVLVAGWSIAEKDLSTETGMKIAAKLPLMKLEFSKSKPSMVMRKSHGYTDSHVDDIIALFSSTPILLNRSDSKEFDRITQSALGKNASAQYFFEDIRLARKQNIADNENTIDISVKLREMKGDSKKLRDALFLIGEQPDKDVDVDDLYYMLSNQVVNNPKSEARRKFMEYIVTPTLSEKEIEVSKYIKKGLGCGVIEERQGYLVFGSRRLGVTEQEAMVDLVNEDDIYRSLKIAISNATGLPEDASAANKVVTVLNGSANEARGVAFVQDLAKKRGLATRPDLIFAKVNSLEDAVTKFNELANKQALPADSRISVQFVNEEIGA
jgi:hypothetical protein